MVSALKLWLGVRWNRTLGRNGTLSARRHDGTTPRISKWIPSTALASAMLKRTMTNSNLRVNSAPLSDDMTFSLISHDCV